MLAVRVFGPLVIEDGERVLGARDLGGIKPKQLLEILISERGRAVTKARLAELLWGDEPPKHVAATLETYVSILRRNLRTAVVTEPGAYRIASDEIALDLDRFDALRATGARHDLEAALALVRGDVFEDEPYGTWAIRLRELYRERHERTLLDAAQLALDAGDPRAALGHAERALELDRTSERAHRLAMLAHQARGDRDEALAAYQRCRTALADELGVEPQPETTALADAIRRREPVVAIAPAAPRTPKPRSEVPLLGRAGELAALEAAAREAIGGGGAALLLIEGEAGIGKTRIVDELVRRVRGARVGRAKCRALERELAFAPIADALRGFAGEALRDVERFPGLVEIVPEIAGAALGRTRAFESLVAIVAAHAPLVLVFDDLHWADASSLSALAYLARRVAGSPVAIVGSFRSEEVAPDHALRQLEPTVHLELPPLTRGEIAAVGGAELHVKTGGNALLLVEYLRALEEGHTMPAQLRDVVLARSRMAGPEAHRLLVAASVLGRSFDPELLARLVDGDAIAITEQLEALCARRLLATAPSGELFDFRHDLIREILYASLSPARRRYFHARAAAQLEGGSDPGALAYHAELAGSYELAVRSATRAGDEARARWANFEAIAHYERAVRIVDAHAELLEPAARELLWLRLGRAQITVGRAEQAHAILARARDSARARHDEPALFEALEACAVAQHHGASAPSEALAIGQEALALAERLGDAGRIGRAHVLVGGPAGSLGRIDDAIAHCEFAIEHARQAGETPSPVAFARLALAVHHRGDEAAALAWTERAEDAAAAQHAEEVLLMARWVRAMALVGLGRYRDAWTTLDSIATIGRGEETFWHARVPNTYGAILAEACLYERALERDLESLESARKSAARPVREVEVQTLLNLATDRLGLGRLDEARADLEAVRRQVADVEYARFRWVTRLHVLDAEHALAVEDPARALASADSALVLARKHGQARYEVRGRTVHARALAAARKKAPALREARAAAALAEQAGFVGLAWRAWWAASQISGAADDRQRAEAAVARAAAGFDDPLRTAFARAVPVR
ncbi:MAG TPA: AAA family ATPase [Kofleriaceae bacterium]|nr:AAA family ATPase [Kofleriaceae bacterium]